MNRTSIFLQALLRDVFYALRIFWKKPGFALVLVFSLALGIGANTAIFSMVDAVLFRALPVRDAHHLVRIYSKPDYFEGLSNSSYPVYEDYRDQSDVFGGLAAYSDSVAVDVSRSGEKPQRLYAMLASGNYFSLLGARPAQGRLISVQDDRPGSNSVVVLSYRAWQRVFDGTNAIVGAQITLNRHPFTIIGVTQPEFFGVNLEDIPEMWVPVSSVAVAMPDFADLKPLEERGFSWLSMIGKLKPGVGLAQAQSQLDTIAKRRRATQHKEGMDPYPQLVPAQVAAIDPGNRAETSRLSWILLAIVALVLLVSCAVCAGLLLVRAESRQKEIAVRRAIGASSLQIIRQLLVESLLLSLLGAGAGILLAGWVMDLLRASVPAGFPIPLDASAGILNLRVLIFSTGLSLFSGIAFGLAPAIRSARTDLIAPLKNQATVLFDRFRSFNLRTVFVMVQVTLSVMLLIAAGLLIRTLHNATSVNPGFNPDGGLLASIDLSRQGYTEETGRPAFERLLQEVRSLPGVRMAALAKSVPVQNSGMRVTMDVPGPHPQNDVQLDLNIVSPGYFSALGVPVLNGRDFSSSDKKESPKVVIINQTMAKTYFPNSDPVGQELSDGIDGPKKGKRRIIGVVADFKIRSVREATPPAVFLCLSQTYMSRMTILVRSSGHPENLVPALTSVVARINKDLPLFQMETLREHLRVTLARERILTWLLTAFGAIALSLAVLGLYSVVAFTTEVRTSEFGIRMAIGAQRADVLKLVLSQGLALAGIGLAAGLAGSTVVSRALSSLLFGVAPRDMSTFVSVAVLMGLVCLGACALPAYRATRVDPSTALRYE